MIKITALLLSLAASSLLLPDLLLAEHPGSVDTPLSDGGLVEFSVSFDQYDIVQAVSKTRSDINMGGPTTPPKIESQTDTRSRN